MHTLLFTFFVLITTLPAFGMKDSRSDCKTITAALYNAETFDLYLGQQIDESKAIIASENKRQQDLLNMLQDNRSKIINLRGQLEAARNEWCRSPQPKRHKKNKK